MATGEQFTIFNESIRLRVLDILKRAPLRDERGRPLVVTMERVSGPELASAKRRWHAYVRLIAMHVGASAPDMKRQIKEHLLGTEEVVNKITGAIEQEPPHIADLNDEQMKALNEQTKQLAAEHFGLILPDSREEWDSFKTVA